MTEYDGVERSKTKQLRALLDKRGVEWNTNETLTDCWTRWVAGKLRCTATEINGTFAFTVGNSTPEQAVEATLGKEMCEVDTSFTWDRPFCDPYWEHELSCGHTITTMEPELPNYCPECGRRIKQ